MGVSIEEFSSGCNQLLPASCNENNQEVSQGLVQIHSHTLIATSCMFVMSAIYIHIYYGNRSRPHDSRMSVTEEIPFIDLTITSCTVTFSSPQQEPRCT